MTHTSGFEETAKDMWLTSPNDLVPIGDYVKAHIPARIFPPGVTPAYSNYATTVAGYIVQRVSGESISITSRTIFSIRWACTTRPFGNRCRRT